MSKREPPTKTEEDKKIDLIFRACKIVTEMESRGSLLREVQPKARIVIHQDDDDDYVSTDIVLDFKNNKTIDACNWGGYGRSLNEALTSNLWCLRFEIKERMNKLNAIMAELKDAAPLEDDDKDASPETE